MLLLLLLPIVTAIRVTVNLTNVIVVDQVVIDFPGVTCDQFGPINSRLPIRTSKHYSIEEYRGVFEHGVLYGSPSTWNNTCNAHHSSYIAMLLNKNKNTLIVGRQVDDMYQLVSYNPAIFSPATEATLFICFELTLYEDEIGLYTLKRNCDSRIRIVTTSDTIVTTSDTIDTTCTSGYDLMLWSYCQEYVKPSTDRYSDYLAYVVVNNTLHVSMGFNWKLYVNDKVAVHPSEAPYKPRQSIRLAKYVVIDQAIVRPLLVRDIKVGNYSIRHVNGSRVQLTDSIVDWRLHNTSSTWYYYVIGGICGAIVCGAIICGTIICGSIVTTTLTNRLVYYR